MLNRNISRHVAQRGFPLDQFFESFWNPAGENNARAVAQFTPKCEIEENEKEYLMHFEVPGMKEEDLNVEVKDGVLTVSGEHQQQNEKNEKTYHYSERSYGSFERSFALPENVNLSKIEAKHERGILTVVAAKKEVTAPLKVPIKTKADDSH